MSMFSSFILQKPNPPMPAILELPMRAPLRHSIRDKLILQEKYDDNMPCFNDIKRNEQSFETRRYYRPNGSEIKQGNPVGAIPFIREQALHPEIATDLYCKEIRNPDNTIYKSAYSCMPNEDVMKRIAILDMGVNRKQSRFEQG